MQFNTVELKTIHRAAINKSCAALCVILISKMSGSVAYRRKSHAQTNPLQAANILRQGATTMKKRLFCLCCVCRSYWFVMPPSGWNLSSGGVERKIILGWLHGHLVIRCWPTPLRWVFFSKPKKKKKPEILHLWTFACRSCSWQLESLQNTNTDWLLFYSVLCSLCSRVIALCSQLQVILG